MICASQSISLLITASTAEKSITSGLLGNFKQETNNQIREGKPNKALRTGTNVDLTANVKDWIQFSKRKKYSLYYEPELKLTLGHKSVGIYSWVSLCTAQKKSFVLLLSFPPLSNSNIWVSFTRAEITCFCCVPYNV